MYRHFVAGLFLVSTLVSAGQSELQEKIQARFPTATVESVSETQISGLYEVIINDSIYYVDQDFTHLIDGSLIEVETMRNVTSERLGQIEEDALRKVAIPFEDLPFDMAIKRVFGSGEREFAYFADPNCGYCRKFDDETLGNLTDATLYLFLYPVITDRSIPLSRAIWCHADPASAWDDYIFNGVVPASNELCDNPIDSILDFGKEKRVRATPTLFFADGTRVSGALTLDQLEERLNR